MPLTVFRDTPSSPELPLFEICHRRLKGNVPDFPYQIDGHLFRLRGKPHNGISIDVIILNLKDILSLKQLIQSLFQPPDIATKTDAISPALQVQSVQVSRQSRLPRAYRNVHGRGHFCFTGVKMKCFSLRVSLIHLSSLSLSIFP